MFMNYSEQNYLYTLVAIATQANQDKICQNDLAFYSEFDRMQINKNK